MCCTIRWITRSVQHMSRLCVVCKEALPDDRHRQQYLHPSCRQNPPPEVKLCVTCGESLPSRRFKYHQECRSQARADARKDARRCSKCRLVKPPGQFSKDNTRVDGKFPWCIDCQVKSNGSHKWQDPEGALSGLTCPVDDTPIRGRRNRVYCSTKCKDRANALRGYGLTPAQFRAMVAGETSGLCPVCGRRPTRWNVDHNHQTGKVTGVVCAGCNAGILAYSMHDTDLVRSLLRYLEHNPADRAGVVVTVPPGLGKSSSLHKKWQHHAV